LSITNVINIRNACNVQGWRKNPAFIYIGRGRGKHAVRDPKKTGYFGNPFTVADHGREGCIELYEAWAESGVRTDPVFREAVKDLFGKTLVCYCAPLACHGDVLAKLAAELNPEYASLTEDQVEIMRHALGSGHSTSVMGWRNRYCAPSTLFPTLDHLCSLGLMSAGSDANFGGSRMYHVTAVGMKLCGATEQP